MREEAEVDQRQGFKVDVVAVFNNGGGGHDMELRAQCA